MTSTTVIRTLPMRASWPERFALRASEALAAWAVHRAERRATRRTADLVREAALAETQRAALRIAGRGLPWA